MPSAKYTKVSFPRVYPQEEVADHEILMAFDGDSDAIAFHDWWHEQGSEVFAFWLKRRREAE